MKHLFFYLLWSSISLQPVFAQGSAAKQPAVSLNHIALYVHDLASSTAFYENILQLQTIPEPFHDGKHTWFRLGEHSALHLIQGAVKGIKHDKNEHLCFSVPSLEPVIASLDKSRIDYTNWAGTEKAPTVRVDGVKQIYFQDPDGHWVEVNTDFHQP